MLPGRPSSLAPSLAKRCRIVLLAGLWLVPCLVGVSAGGTGTKGAERYLIKNWTTADGLPENTVRAIVEGANGYFWIGTANGLARFDGVRFKVFNSANTPSLFSDDIYGLCEDHSGTFWLNTRRGLIRFYEGAFEAAALNEGGPPVNFTDPTEDKARQMWFHNGSQLARWDGSKLVVVPLGPEEKTITDICAGAEGGLWVAGGAAVWRFHEGKMERAPAGPLPQLIATTHDGSLWGLVGERRLCKLENGKWCEVADFGEERCRTIYAARNGDVWVGAASRNRAFRVRGGVPMEISGTDGLEGNRAIGFCEDADGNVWLGMNGAGLYRLREPRLRVFNREDGLQALSLASIAEDPAGTIFVNVMGWTLHRFNGRSFVPLSIPVDTEAYVNPTTVIGASEGGVWAGTFNGSLARIVDGEVVQRIGAQSGTRALFTDRQGGLWRGTRVSGVEYFSGTNLTRFGVKEGLSFEDVYCFAQDKEGALWVGTEDGLNRIANGRITRFETRDGLGHRFITALCADSRGTIWAGTLGGGLSAWVGSRFRTMTTQQGLPDDTVTQLIEDDDGFLWIGTRAGLWRVATSALHEFLAGKAAVVTGTLVGRNDGLTRPDTWTEYQPSAIKAQDGRLWFCTRSGVAVIDPRHFVKSARPPVVHLEEFTVDGVTRELGRAAPQTIRVLPGRHRLEIRFTGISPSEAELVRFQHRLMGYDADWIEGGQSRVASYSRVPPGSYKFLVRASNNDGTWSNGGDNATIIVEPAFWQTLGFRALLVVLMAGLGPAFYFWRTRQLEHRRAAQEAFSRRLLESQEHERKRIAAELHDSLGQNLLVIKNRAALALTQPDQPAKMAAHLNEVSAIASAAIHEVREIAQNLRPFQLDELGLTKSIASIARKLGTALPIEVESHLDDVDGALPTESEIHFYRVVQECVNNILKHSQATHATIELRRQPELLHLMIKDNGRGFAIDEPGKPLGFGLRNITERVRAMGGRVTFHSRPGAGTRVEVELPAQRATAYLQG